MPLNNTEDRYGSISKLFHWSVMLLIFTLIPLGIFANRLAHAAETDPAAYGRQAAFWFSLHKTLGVTLLALAILRILWTLTQTKPAPLHSERKVETFLAGTVHWLLYASLILVPLAGWVSHAASAGFAPIWWPAGQGLPLVPQSTAVKEIAGNLHIIFERVLVIALFLHIAGALKHHFIDKDATLRRMWFGKIEVPDLSLSRHISRRSTGLAAVAVYLIALGVGAGMGLYRVEAAPVSAVATPSEASRTNGQGNWQVQGGAINITVQQFGSPVEGQFGEWSAEIDFDETTGSGTVEVDIDISSLSLGSVTDQAMGPSYFDAQAHPEATFRADISPAETDNAYLANGTLTLKGSEIPTSLPFTLIIDGDTAQMEGSLTLDRREFSIGGDDPDPGYEVPVVITLTAQRGAT
ncbi:cytochrome b/b6 domain-containing protein [Aestuariibius insulae]|uniref:cytochrome b/b6 domain-containing protein n=1 Tax=Aestuariibius insulae TaxID=2058287 RepID=UPI00345EC539